MIPVANGTSANNETLETSDKANKINEKGGK